MSKNYNVSETAKRLGYSKNSIYNFLKEGLIDSVRIGKGKFRIPESEIEKFEVARAENKTSDEKSEQTEKKECLTTPAIPISAILPSPRPGSSLADISGESGLHTLKLWLQERAGFPTLFDWLICLTSVILGISLFLYSSQLDNLSVGRFAMWLNPIRLGMIFGGIGLILASMIQGEVSKLANLTNYFRFFLSGTFIGLAVILINGGDVVGFCIHGLFGLMILVEAVSGLRSATLYTLYNLGILTAMLLVYRFASESSSLTIAVRRIRETVIGFDWIVSFAIFALLAAGIYSFMTRKIIRGKLSMVYGVIFCLLAVLYGTQSNWSRSFAILIAGLVGLVLPFWESFKVRVTEDHSLVYKMFGLVLMCFSIAVMTIGMVQKVLLSYAYQDLQDKSELVKVELVNKINNTILSATELAKNSAFVGAVGRAKTSEIEPMIKLLTIGRQDISMVAMVNTTGDIQAVYPSSTQLKSANFANEDFFVSVSNSGKSYVAKQANDLYGGIKKVVVIAVPVANSRNVFSGVLVVALSGVNVASELQRYGQVSLGQEVFVIGGETKYLVHPKVDLIGTGLVEAMDDAYKVWKNNLKIYEGYNWQGKHVVFGAISEGEYGSTVIVSQPIRMVLGTSAKWLTWVLAMQLLVGLLVFVAFMWAKNGKERSSQ